ncbi:putative phosphoinositide-binding protein [Leptomonas pyrrhocoris]|uniref:Putative phosphoinositide-binding protein n=1 Tax=Leptomonas pyrrhocoris TaxID=157538 RepID=A0A0N0E0A2_LEPPY|nr:putative phosphoinositide-binding protein [Leptomonas pyrrhocoris]XP_015664655.1 putative phosphoinositide-binding protein [Leptomonas pyrrhocoris]XP_015664656.1 putative phosphoinositide-binding protein [Leptomonas pyrrhocoris]KPA86215.1 putative phosphoinositide-binding protein [Leptomonas pyrrhocoris]KPA86216.1 putative phosphoinositide-binding protein [Leptomonas pyrrhocoris]KPA86217.1 putative phosphoinositide-binding protein [Leptomonas pyrrhocoris]|eukprot:XP_015664654.1 putative phosphoinositide-binding protein [Leptomonas pyrrhocoris]
MAAGVPISVKVDVPLQVQGHGTLEMSYHLYPITMRLPGFMSDARFNRRYSDFETLRAQLTAVYWYCIVPPIPEKESVQDKLGKLPRMVTTGGKDTPRAETDLLEYRRISLRRFLQRLAYHPILGKSELLQKFTNDNEWRQCTRDPVKSPPFLAPSLEERAKSWVSSNAGSNAVGSAGGGGVAAAAATAGGAGGVPISPSGAAYQSALTQETVDASTWKATVEYVAGLETNLKNLRNLLETLVDRHRRNAVAVNNFAASFGLLAEGEEDAELRGAVEGVRDCGRKVADVYSKHADNESTRLVSTLSFYVGMCAAVRETLSHMFSAQHYLRNLVKKGQDLQSSMARGQQSNVAQIQSDIQFVNEQRARLEEDLHSAEKTFRDEFVLFHENKQYDAKDMLKKFGVLELSFSESMKQEWEALVPMINTLRS